MKRRTFIQSLAAVFALPAAPSLSLPGASAAVPAATAVPTQARFWAIYMSALHGECTPQTLTNLLHIPQVDAKRYVTQLIADGVIKPNPILQDAVSELVKPKDETLLDKAKKRLEKKSQTQSGSATELPKAEHETKSETACQTEADTDEPIASTDEHELDDAPFDDAQLDDPEHALDDDERSEDAQNQDDTPDSENDPHETLEKP